MPLGGVADILCGVLHLGGCGSDLDLFNKGDVG